MTALESSLFSLSPLPDLDSRPFIDIELDARLPTHQLPRLDEYAPGAERLLKGLDSSYYGLQNGSPTRKGKEREISPEVGELSPGEVKALELDWVGLGAAADHDGARVFEPLRWWDARDGARETAAQMMSEQPPLFDALSTSLRPKLDPLMLTNVSSIPRSSEELLSLMMRATLGAATSEELVWDKKESRFVWKGPEPAGTSRQAASSSVDRFLRIGTAVKRLELIVDTHSSTPLTPTHHALFHAVTTNLTYVKDRLAVTIAGSSDLPWNAVIASLSEIDEIASLLCEVMCWPLGRSGADGLPARASSLLTHLYAFLVAQLDTSVETSARTLLCAYLMSQSSGPFLSLLHAWLGLATSPADEDDDATSQPWADLGVTRTALPSSAEGEARWAYDFASRKMPAFIPKELRKTLFQAGRSLRLLREASGGQHPLCRSDGALQSGWGWGETQTVHKDAVKQHLRRAKRDIEYWRHSVKDRSRLKGSSSMLRLKQPRKERRRLPAEFTRPQTPSPPATNDKVDAGFPVDSLWSQFSLAPGAHIQSTPAPLWTPSPLAELHAFVDHHSTESNPLLADSPSIQIYISNHLLFPLLAHAKLVSTSLVSLYLDDLRLLEHYDTMRSYFLGDNVLFFERVSAALFGKDEAGAGEALGLGKRARTRARLGLGGDDKAVDEGVWGIGLGLGLSERARWPPGGAELAYALRTTLLGDEQKGGGGDDVEQRLSFAVKSLPEDDKDGKRARWMDPQAIECVTKTDARLTELTSRALDFLFLAYSAPPSIAPVLPASIMAKHQIIHNLLLRVCRVKTVIKSLYLDSVHKTPLFDEPVKQGVDAGSRPSSRAGKGKAIRQPTRTLQLLFPQGHAAGHALQRLRFRMSEFMAVLEQYLLDTAIGSNWEVMRRKLDMLKRRAPGSDASIPSTPVDEPAEYVSPGLEVDTTPTGDALGQFSDHEEDENESTGLVQLNSIDSLVVYHHHILDRILRACLLAPSAGQQVTYKVLMGLFGCILDLGKAIKQVERGTMGWQDGAERVERYRQEWEEREKVFLHALERLSLRTEKKDGREEGRIGEGDERDLEILLGDEEGEGNDRVDDGGCLGELVVRLSFAGGSRQ